jgi:hypothetical protein
LRSVGAVVVVVDPTESEGVVAVVVVAAPEDEEAMEPCNDARIEQATTDARVNPGLDRLRTRTARRERPDRNEVKFMPAPRCQNA